jgi:hypothetical protein
MVSKMNILHIAARVANEFSQPLSDRPDYGSREMVSQREETGFIKKTPGKGYCVKSEKNPEWSGGCYPSKSKAEERLLQVEKFKHMKKGSLELEEKDLAIILSPDGRSKVYLGSEEIGSIERATLSSDSNHFFFFEGSFSPYRSDSDSNSKVSASHFVDLVRSSPFFHIPSPKDPF